MLASIDEAMQKPATYLRLDPMPDNNGAFAFRPVLMTPPRNLFPKDARSAFDIFRALHLIRTLQELEMFRKELDEHIHMTHSPVLGFEIRVFWCVRYEAEWLTHGLSLSSPLSKRYYLRKERRRMYSCMRRRVSNEVRK